MKATEISDMTPAQANAGAGSSPSGHSTPESVLFIIDELCESGGAERSLLKMIRLLPPDQFRCLLVTFKLDRNGIFETLPCPTYVFPLSRTWGINALRVALQLRKLIRREHISIVNTFFETSDLWAGMISRLCGVEVLVSSRRDMGILRSPKHDLAYRVVNRFYDAILTVSDKVRERCIQHDHIPPRRLVTVYNGVDLREADSAAQATRAELSIPDSAPIVATVGHIRKVKGIDTLIRAAAAVRSTFPNVVFLVVGDIAELDHYRELLELRHSLRLDSTVKFIGSSEAVFSILKLCDVFCLPSRSEGFSNALIEAMACSKPCVATRVGGNDEAVQDGLTGFLVDAENATSMAERITALLADRKSAARMGMRGRQVVEARFSDGAISTQLADLYKALLKRKT